MKKLTSFIVEKRYFILFTFLIMSTIAFFVSKNVNINYDMVKYLPKDSETKIGYKIMNQEFEGIKSSTLNVMFEGISNDYKNKIYESLKNIDGVSSVNYENTDKYNVDNYTLYIINVNDEADSKTASNVYNKIKEDYKDYNIETSGSISEKNKPVLHTWIIIFAVSCAMVILIIMCNSYFEPFLFLFSILIGVVLNSGTNIFFDSVSNITNSITAILQMALSMDYSIMLMNRYIQEKETEKDKVKAMKHALYKSFLSISSSSITTIVGLLALVFMSFTIGRDLGFVLAKGVLFSLLSIFFVLPGLIILFDKLITKTQKKKLNINLKWLGNFSYNFRKVMPIIFLIIFCVSYILKNDLNIVYTGSLDDEIQTKFKENNQIALIYSNKDEKNISEYCKNLENNNDIDKVLCYGNTINEKLTYQDLNRKLNNLGSDVKVDDYLLKILYYKYYNKDENNKMTFNEFVNFVQNEVYNNEIINNKFDSDMKSNIDKLNYFAKKEEFNKKRSAKDLANILGIDESRINDVLIYYNSKSIDTVLSIEEFINFLKSDILTNEKYSSNISGDIKNKINELSNFANKSAINKKMNSNEMSKLFGISKPLTDSLYTYYLTFNNIDLKISINEFSNFILNDLINDKNYSSMFDENTINNIKMMKNFSDISLIDKEVNSNELSNLFGLDENNVKKLLLLKYSNMDDGTLLTLPQFINNINNIKNNTNYLDDINTDSITKLYMFAKNENNINTTKMNKQNLELIFNDISYGLTDIVYNSLNLPDDYMFSPQEFVSVILNNLSDYMSDADKANLQILKLVIDDSMNDNATKYSAQQLAELLKIDNNSMFKLYALIDLVNNNTSNWVMSPYEFVNLIINNSDMKEISSNIDSNVLNTLNMIKNIMDSSKNGSVYSYSELSNIIGIDSNTIKNIYSIYISKYKNTTMSPYEFVNFILNHKNDKMLAGNLNNSTINELLFVKNIMDGIQNNKRYNAGELSNLLGMNADDISLLYAVYKTNYINSNNEISLKDFVEFLINDVMKNEKYSGNFDHDTKNKLNIINGIMNSIVKEYKYSKEEICTILINLASNIDSTQIELLYIYYGSCREYNNEWTLTVQEFVNYLNDNILKDERFTDFINNDMRENIVSAKKTVGDAKKMLVGKNYSRVVINTKLDKENDKTFNFIRTIKNDLNKEKKLAYLVGDSPMAYEMSQSFNGELNLITILTMILIFIVVAITFKSIIIPAILVLIIQCAVYITMGVLSLLGGPVYFISILIVQSILMGATIDYAILYTSYYKESRNNMNIKDSLINAYNKSIHTILTSASILIIVTLIVGNFASAVAAKICKTLSQGTLFSAILILFVLPSIIALFDKLICRKKSYK